MSLSDYEAQQLKAIHEWKSPTKSWLDRLGELMSWPIDQAGDQMMKTPGVGWVIRKSVEGAVSICTDVGLWTVRPEAIYSEYRDGGHSVQGADDILSLDLKQVDRTIGWLAAKYKSLAGLEGAAAGAAGAVGIPADVAALLTLNLRAIGEYAVYCGFDINSQQERLFAMHVLGLASSPKDASKVAAIAQLVRIAQDVAKRRAWKDLERHGFVQVVKQLAKALGIRLTKAKLAQLIPALGAGVGAGFNAFFTSKVCDAAYHLYRERLLANKYGDATIIEETAPPADELTAGYGESDEQLPPDDGPPMPDS